MKSWIALFLLAISATPMFGQQIQMQCRALDNGGYVDQGETIVKGNGGSYLACRPVRATAPVTQSATTPASEAPAPAYHLRESLPAAPAYFGAPAFPRVSGAFGYEFASGLIGANSYSGNSGRRNGNGLFGELVFNADQYVSVAVNADAAYAKNLPQAPGASYVAYASYLAGPQFYPARHETWSPFARVMFGGTFLNTDYLYYLGSPTNRQNALAFSVGGGMDYKLSEGRIGVRLFQFDYSRAWKDGFYLSVFKFGTGFSF